MARAARLSGAEPDDDEYQEFEEMLEHAETAQDFASRAKLAVQNLVQKVGFFGILACASIPNPLFDLAGITCGHFLVPFWTFFGATLIGKAIIKMHIQKIFVIITFSKHIVEQMVAFIGAVPGVGPSLQKPFQEYLEAQRQKLHHKSEMGTPQVRLDSVFFSSPPPWFQAEITFTALTGIFRQIERGLSVSLN